MPSKTLTVSPALIPDDFDSILERDDLFSLKKRDVSTSVGVLKGRVMGFQGDLLVKTFESKGFFDLLRKMLFGSRAGSLWKISHKLSRKGLAVPLPVSYREPSFRMQNGLYLSAFIENADNLGNMYKRRLFPEPGEIARTVGKAVAAFHAAGAVHGDLKWSNILLRRDGPEWTCFLVDFDQTKCYRKVRAGGVIKDLARFYRYGLELGAETWVDEQFFPAYLSSAPGALREKIDLATAREKARRDWEKRGRRRYRVD